MFSLEKIIIRLNKLVRNFFFHIVFWECCFLFYTFLTGESQLFKIYFNFIEVESIYLNALIFGLFTSILFTLLDIIISGRILLFLPSWFTVFFKSLVYCVSVFIIILFVTKPLARVLLISNSTELLNELPPMDIHFIRFLVYFYFSCFLNTFFKGMAQKVGRRNFYNWIFGLLNKPREEERIFMFIDMKSSTTIAEKLLHKKFSSLVRDVFYDMSVVDNYNGEIYQYLGDGAIVSWNLKNGIKRNNVLKSFYAFTKVVSKRSKYYQRKYGLVPKFKAGIHVGKVIVMQVGLIKRDISYNGDTLNTAARIESQCNEYKQNLLISGDLYVLINDKNEFQLKNVGNIKLKGKKKGVEIFQVKKL